MLNDLLDWLEGRFRAAFLWVEGVYYRVTYDLTTLAVMDWSATTWLVLLGTALFAVGVVYSLYDEWRISALQRRHEREKKAMLPSPEAVRRNRKEFDLDLGD